MDNIPGGFYIKARCVQQSDISTAPPHVREIWDWFLMNANHKDIGKIKRGQLLTSYNEILEGLSWHVGYRKCRYSKGQCETAMKYLTKRTMITTKRTTRGMIVTVVNYDKYQNVKNYENHNGTDNEPTREPHVARHDKQECKNELDSTLSGTCDSGESPKDICPQQEILSLWREILPELTQPRVWNGTRATNLRARWKSGIQSRRGLPSNSLEFWGGLFKYIKTNDFLMGRVSGRNGKPFKCSLDWVVKNENFLKIVEGKYD